MTDPFGPVAPTSTSAARHARDLARQIKAGGKFRCPKTRKETTMERCLEKRRQDALERAQGQGGYYPCLECALVTPETLMPPEKPRREPAPMPAKARAKKEPPRAVQPNIQEAKAKAEVKPKTKERTMSSLSAVKTGRPEQKYNWKKCPRVAGNPNYEPPFMTITNNLHIGISAQAVRDFGLQEICGIVFYFSDSPRAIGMELHKNPTPESHILAIKKHAGRLSSKRFIKINGLEDLRGRRFRLRQERPGFLVADLEG